MWQSRNKNDLIIEVWERLDCENVGAAELEAIETVVADVFGASAVDSPMIIARLLADEGAELRHSEVMELFVERSSDRPYDAAFLNILDTADFGTTLRSIRQMENLRRRFVADDDREGQRLLREKVIDEKKRKLSVAQKMNRPPSERLIDTEIAEWLALWLLSPEVFENWITLRRRSEDFISKFGEI